MGQWGAIIGLLVTVFGLGMKTEDYFDDQRRGFFLQEARGDDPLRVGCALAGLIDDKTRKDFDACIKKGKVRGQIINSG